ncbi:UNVERIFIED_ORG: hypothetical protein [Escherichia phage CMSTMSU]
MGTVGTHCFTWNPNSSKVRIDTNDTCYADLSTESDLESVMFQHMLIHKPNEILYLVAFSYLLQNYKSGFTIETDIDEIMDEIPSLKDILEEKISIRTLEIYTTCTGSYLIMNKDDILIRLINSLLKFVNSDSDTHNVGDIEFKSFGMYGEDKTYYASMKFQDYYEMLIALTYEDVDQDGVPVFLCREW